MAGETELGLPSVERRLPCRLVITSRSGAEGAPEPYLIAALTFLAWLLPALRLPSLQVVAALHGALSGAVIK